MPTPGRRVCCRGGAPGLRSSCHPPLQDWASPSRKRRIHLAPPIRRVPARPETDGRHARQDSPGGQALPPANPGPRCRHPLPTSRCPSRRSSRPTRIALGGLRHRPLALFAQGRGSAPPCPRPWPRPRGSSAARRRPGAAARPHGPALPPRRPGGAGPRARRAGPPHPASGQREDVLVQGDFAGIDVPYLRLTLTETRGDEAEPSLFVTLARRGAEAQGLAVLRSGERGVIATRFGAVETLEITLGGEGKRICTGFISRQPGPLRLDGWLCAPLRQAPRPALSPAPSTRSPERPSLAEGDAAFTAFERARDPACAPRIDRVQEVGGETGSIPNRRARKK